ncbi:hypothetical protein AYI68_g6268 [Smittium mucronatum]|uniref:Uncharacterized protein n=1 Tax=Smittium mucronatum TaxID=133383 RepID=A0A1R0GS00_9FUNG|nr:hypothetical protein AYI68_g6268 [Smittium mucronatum]
MTSINNASLDPSSTFKPKMPDRFDKKDSITGSENIFSINRNSETRFSHSLSPVISDKYKSYINFPHIKESPISTSSHFSLIKDPETAFFSNEEDNNLNLTSFSYLPENNTESYPIVGLMKRRSPESICESRKLYSTRLGSLVDKIYSLYVENIFNSKIYQEPDSLNVSSTDHTPNDWIYQMDDTSNDKIANPSGFYMNRFLDCISNSPDKEDCKEEYTQMSNLFWFKSVYLTRYDPLQSKVKLCSVLSSVSKLLLEDIKKRLSYNESMKIEEINNFWDAGRFPENFESLIEYNSSILSHLFEFFNLNTSKEMCSLQGVKQEWASFTQIIYNSIHHMKKSINYNFPNSYMDYNINSNMSKTSNDNEKLNSLAKIGSEIYFRKSNVQSQKKDFDLSSLSDFSNVPSVEKLFFSVIFDTSKHLIPQIQAKHFKRSYVSSDHTSVCKLAKVNYNCFHENPLHNYNRKLDLNSTDPIDSQYRIGQSNENFDGYMASNLSCNSTHFLSNISAPSNKPISPKFRSLKKLACIWYLLPLSKIKEIGDFRTRILPILKNPLRNISLVSNKFFGTRIAQTNNSSGLCYQRGHIFEGLSDSNLSFEDYLCSASVYRNFEPSIFHEQLDSQNFESQDMNPITRSHSLPNFINNSSQNRDSINLLPPYNIEPYSRKNCTICKSTTNFDDDIISEFLESCDISLSFCNEHRNLNRANELSNGFINLDPVEIFKKIRNSVSSSLHNNKLEVSETINQIISELFKSNELDSFLCYFDLENYDYINGSLNLDQCHIFIKNIVLDSLAGLIQGYMNLPLSEKTSI